MIDNPIVLFLLTVVWIPSFIGTIYLWRTYLAVRSAGGQWILQTMSITAIPITLVLMYVSGVTYARSAGWEPSTEFSIVAGLLLVFGLLSWPVPLKAWRIWQATHEEIPQPGIPITKNGKVTDGSPT